MKWLILVSVLIMSGCYVEVPDKRLSPELQSLIQSCRAAGAASAWVEAADSGSVFLHCTWNSQ